MINLLQHILYICISITIIILPCAYLLMTNCDKNIIHILQDIYRIFIRFKSYIIVNTVIISQWSSITFGHDFIHEFPTLTLLTYSPVPATSPTCLMLFVRLMGSTTTALSGTDRYASTVGPQRKSVHQIPCVLSLCRLPIVTLAKKFQCL